MRYIIILCFLALVRCQAQESSVSDLFSGSLINGRLWNSSSKDGKLMYISGALDGIRATQQSNGLPNRLSKQSTVGDYIKEVDKLYNERENVKIPVIWAIGYYVILKLKGEIKSSELEDSLIALRKQASALN